MISKIPSLVIFNGGEKQVIKNASYGNISDNGDFLVYSGGLKSDPENLSASLRVRNLKIGGERDLGLEGMFANISPDNKTICYLGFEMNDLNEPEDAYIGTCNIEGKERKVLMPLGKGFRGALYSPPEWINNNEMIYAAKDPKGKDLELFIMNKSGKIKQLTDNDTQESSPQHYKNNIIFYVRGDEKDRGELFFAKPSGGKLVHQNLEIDAFYPKIRGDKIVYFGNLDTKDCSANLYIANVKDLLKGDKSSIVNLSKIIKKDIEAKKIF